MNRQRSLVIEQALSTEAGLELLKSQRQQPFPGRQQLPDDEAIMAAAAIDAKLPKGKHLLPHFRPEAEPGSLALPDHPLENVTGFRID
jgi:hypothetical protein